MREMNLTEHSHTTRKKRTWKCHKSLRARLNERAMVSEKNKVSRDMRTQYTDASVIRGYFL